MNYTGLPVDLTNITTNSSNFGNYFCYSSTATHFLPAYLLVFVPMITIIWFLMEKRNETFYTAAPVGTFIAFILATIAWAFKCPTPAFPGYIVAILLIATALLVMLRVMVDDG